VAVSKRSVCTSAVCAATHAAASRVLCAQGGGKGGIGQCSNIYIYIYARVTGRKGRARVCSLVALQCGLARRRNSDPAYQVRCVMTLGGTVVCCGSFPGGASPLRNFPRQAGCRSEIATGMRRVRASGRMLDGRVGPGLRPGQGRTGCDRLRRAESRIRHARGVLAIVLARGRTLGHGAIECDRACTTPRLGPGPLSNRELSFTGGEVEVGSASVDEMARLPLRLITRKNALPRKRALLAADEPPSSRAFRRLHIDAEQLTNAMPSHLASADEIPRCSLAHTRVSPLTHARAHAHDISRPTGRHLNL
jgi:hypothetical protein